MELVHRTIRDRLYKYFTHKNTRRCIDDLPTFVKAYNDTVPSTTSTAPLGVTDSDELAIWKRMEARRRGRLRVGKSTTFSLGQRLGISKEKMRIAKTAKENFSIEVFRVAKVIDWRPRVVNVL